MIKILFNTIVFIISLPFILITIPLGIFSFLEKHLSSFDYIYAFGAHTVALVPGLIGNNVRAVYYLMTLDYFHPSVIVSFGSYFSKRGVSIKEKSGIGAYCIIGLADIGKNVRIASKVSITSGLYEHGNSTRTNSQAEDEGVETKVHIGDKCWIGEGALIAASVGDNCVIGIGAVVIKPIPENCLAMGNPARALPTA